MQSTLDSEPDTKALFRCEECGHEQRVGSNLAGKRVRCPECGQVGRVGVSEPRPSKKPLTALPEDVGAERAAVPAQRPDAGGHGKGSYSGEIAPTGGNGATPTPAAPNRGAPPARPAEKPVPPIVKRQDPVPASAEPRTRCPYCREEILTAARKCKHCGEYLDEQLRWQRSQPVSQKSPAHVAQGQAPQSRGPGLGFDFSNLHLPKNAKTGAICALVVLVGVGVYLATRGGSGPGKAEAGPTGRVVYGGTAQPGAGSGVAGSASPAGSPAAAPALDGLVTALRKDLEGSEAKDSAGSVTKFPAAGQGDEPWACTARDFPGKGPGAVIEMPYRLASMEAKKAPSSKGRMIVEVVKQSGGWVLQSVFRQAMFLGSPGSEVQIPDEDRQTVRLRENDVAFARVKEALKAAQAGS